tara:strand:+ start:1557 stop:2402 length:846 start_codon:yes stop_codon:yes gene_type:complete
MKAILLMMEIYQKIKIIFSFILLCFFTLISFYANANDRELIIQSTTSTRDSGFYEFIVPKFNELYQISVKVISVGTGQAILNAKNCDGDILIVHSKADEDNFVNSGYGSIRKNLMYNDYVVIGPSNVSSNFSNYSNVTEVFKNILTYSIFVSRGDDSGTHKAEKRIWNISTINPSSHSKDNYLETGQGMGATLNIAIGLNAYTLSDRATWLNFKNKSDHKIVYEKDPLLFNQYGITIINDRKCPNINKEAAVLFFNWITSDEAKKLINSYRVNGFQLFFTE